MSARPARARRWSDPDREWLEAKGSHVQYRASLEQDMAAMREVRPDLALGTTPLVQAAKELGLPAVYFTNMVSARPLLGPAGAGALAAIVAAQTAAASASAGWSSSSAASGPGTPPAMAGRSCRSAPEAHRRPGRPRWPAATSRRRGS